MYYVLIIITAYNLFVAIRYIRKLEIWLNQENYVFWDHMHSLQHISIVGMTAMMSVAMLFGVVSDYTLLVYIVYNATLSFIVYPHLFSEE